MTCFFKCAFCAQVWKLCLWRIKDFSWSVHARIIVMIANLAVQDTIHYGILFIDTSTRLETINSHSLIGKPYLVTIVCNVYRKKNPKNWETVRPLDLRLAFTTSIVLFQMLPVHFIWKSSILGCTFRENERALSLIGKFKQVKIENCSFTENEAIHAGK